MPIWDNAENICIWGYGAEGQAAHRFLKQHCPNAAFTIMQDKAEGTDQITPDTFKPNAYDLVVKSPGISLYHPTAQQAQKVRALAPPCFTIS